MQLNGARNPRPLGRGGCQNIGNHSPETLMNFIESIESALGKKSEKNYLPMQAGDVPTTYADVQDLMIDVDFKPDTPLQDGIRNFVDWYRHYYDA